MDIGQLETFISVADNKSFTRAAELLYVTQPTVSNHISNLERDLDTVLFIRTRKNVSLTKSGQLLYNHALNIINAYKNMTSELKSFNDNLEGHLNIYASSIPRKYFLPSILADFTREFPGIGYSLLNEDSTSVINSLIAGETDFGFVGLKVESSKLEYHKILDDELVFITSKDTEIPTAINNRITSSELLKQPLIIREDGSGTRKLLEDELLKVSKRLENDKLLAVVEDPATILEMVNKSVGCTVISRYEIHEVDRYNVYTIEDLDLTRSFYFCYNKDMQYVPVNRVFRKYMLHAIDPTFEFDESTPALAY